MTRRYIPESYDGHLAGRAELNSQSGRRLTWAILQQTAQKLMVWTVIAACLWSAGSQECRAQIVDIGGALIARGFGNGDGAAEVLVLYNQAIPSAGNILSFSVYKQGTTQFFTGFRAYVLRPTGTPNQYTVLFESSVFSVAAGTPNSVLVFDVPDFAVLAGDRVAHYGAGIPADLPGSSDAVVYYNSAPPPVVPAPSGTITLGTSPYPLFDGARSYSFAAQFTAVPEPHEWSLVAAAGLGVFAFFNRRQKKSAEQAHQSLVS